LFELVVVRDPDKTELFDGPVTNELAIIEDVVVLEEASKDAAVDGTTDDEDAKIEGEYDVALDIGAATVAPDDTLPETLELVRKTEELAESPGVVLDPGPVVELASEPVVTTLEFCDADACSDATLDELNDDEELLDCAWLAI
jgi:hypothetical protein